MYGIDYDWEYPNKGYQWKAYDRIIIETAKVTNVSVALPPWGIRLSREAREAVEIVNLMAYDLFDARGDHSNIYVAGYESIAKVEAQGFEREQIFLGIPTYGRTTDASGDAWPSMRADGAGLSKWDNIIENYKYTDAATGEIKYCDAYVDSYAEVRDKTATAIDNDIGGVMIFRAFCDAPYTEDNSLTKAINEVINQRAAE